MSRMNAGASPVLDPSLRQGDSRVTEKELSRAQFPERAREFRSNFHFVTHNQGADWSQTNVPDLRTMAPATFDRDLKAALERMGKVDDYMRQVSQAVADKKVTFVHYDRNSKSHTPEEHAMFAKGDFGALTVKASDGSLKVYINVERQIQSAQSSKITPPLALVKALANEGVHILSGKGAVSYGPAETEAAWNKIKDNQSSQELEDYKRLVREQVVSDLAEQVLGHRASKDQSYKIPEGALKQGSLFGYRGVKEELEANLRSQVFDTSSMRTKPGYVTKIRNPVTEKFQRYVMSKEFDEQVHADLKKYGLAE